MMVVKPRTGVSAAIVTFYNHLGNNGFVMEDGNSVLVLQGPGQLEINCNNIEKKKLNIVRAALSQLKSKLNKFDKIIVYAGDKLGSKIIKLVSKCGLPAEKMMFIVPEGDWRDKEDATLISSGLSDSKVIKYQEETSEAIWNIYRNILRKGILPQ